VSCICFARDIMRGLYIAFSYALYNNPHLWHVPDTNPRHLRPSGRRSGPKISYTKLLRTQRTSRKRNMYSICSRTLQARDSMWAM
jgi:uncharacterized membrane-anchored protein